MKAIKKLSWFAILHVITVMPAIAYQVPHGYRAI